MKVKELIKMLKELPPTAVIDMSSDEEGNSFGDIDTTIGDGFLIDKDTNNKGSRVITLYPISSEMPEDRYWDEEKKEE